MELKMSLKRQQQIRNQAIGIQMQELVAIKLEKYFSNKKIISYKTNGADIVIYEEDMTQIAECEVKTAIEVFYHKYNKCNRRGMFSIKPPQLNVDFWAFVVRFTDKNLMWNGDIEIWWALGEDVDNYLSKQTLNCINYKLCIDKMQVIEATLDFVEIKNQLN